MADPPRPPGSPFRLPCPVKRMWLQVTEQVSYYPPGKKGPFSLLSLAKKTLPQSPLMLAGHRKTEPKRGTVAGCLH